MQRLLLLLACIAVSFVGRASHFEGADIRYTPEGSRYRVTLTLYARCSSSSVMLPQSSPVGFMSTCGMGFTRTLPRTGIDTLYDAFSCPGFASCTPSSIFNYTISATYSDTVSLAPCASWRMIFSSCCRSGAQSNITNAMSAGVHIEAFLNNLQVPNSSARLANYAVPYVGLNATTVTSLQATDLQGDSIAYELIPARQSQTWNATPTSVTYSPGYSAQQPVGGTGTVLNNSAATLSLTPTLIGQYTIAVRIKDYRQGALVGYAEREWDVRALPGYSPAPLPTTPVSAFQLTTCPGQTHNLSYTFSDPGDSVVITALPDASVTWPITVTGGAGAGSATINLSWTTPSTLNVSQTPFFYIRLKVRDSGCVRGIAWHDVLVTTAQCNTDSVWAGDADGNYVVDLFDPLAIAIAHGKTGPSRPGATTAWNAQWCQNWGTQFLNGVNHKHADCNGDGTVNNSDLTAVTANYGQIHQRDGDDAEQPKETGVPDLYFDLTGINAVPGTTVSVPIKLGTAGSSMSGLYGLATRIQVQNLASTTGPMISYPVSWLGTAANTLRFTKASGNSLLDWAYARTNGTATSGDGTLATLDIQIPATTQAGTPIILRFLQPRLIGSTGAELTGYNVVNDTLMVASGTGVAGASSSVRVLLIVPNPSDRHAQLQLNLASAQAVQLSVTDAVGRAVWAKSVAVNGGSTAFSLSDVDVPAGIYFVRVQPGDGSAAKVVKWMRE